MDVSFSDDQIKTMHQLHGLKCSSIPIIYTEYFTQEQCDYLFEQGYKPAVHLATELMNAQSKKAGTPQWSKCANCGKVYNWEDSQDSTVCSDDCEAEFIASLME